MTRKWPVVDEIHLQEAVRTLWRRKLLLFGSIVTVTVFSIVAVSLMTPVYTAEALVVVESRNTELAGIETVISGLSVNTNTIQTEVAMLRSESLARNVVDQLDLLEDPEFNRYLVPRSNILTSASNILASTIWPEEHRLPEENNAEWLRSNVVNTFLRSLTISPVGQSYVISIQFESENPQKASLIANTIADRYITGQLEIKFEAIRRATEWLSQRSDGLRQKMLEAQRAVEAYRSEMGLVELSGVTGNPTSLTTHQITELNTQIITARVDRAEAEARLQKWESLLKLPNGIESAAEVLDSQLIQRLHEQEAIVQRKEAELATRYGHRHPKMINVRAEIKDIRRNIEDEVTKILRALKNKVEVARSREVSLQGSMEGLKRNAGEESRARIHLRELERQAEADRILYETFLSRFQETSTQENFQQPDARVVSTAQIPVKPSFPNKPLIVGSAFGASVLLAVLLVFILEQLRSNFHSLEELQNFFGVRALGFVPTVPGRSKKRGALKDLVLENPTSVYSETIRSLLTWLYSLNVDRPPKVVLVTSAIAGEGKTTFCISLARAAARAGNRTLLIDCDLRQQAKGSSNATHQDGLVELLSETKSFEEVIQKDPKSNVHLIRMGAKCPTPSDLLDSQRMKDLLVSLSNKYELIVLDSPPVLAAADARILARMANQTVFLVRWARTNREIASAGLKEIVDTGANVAGVVLTRADLKKIGSYGYGGLRPYYGRSQV